MISSFGVFEGRGWDRKPQNALAYLQDSMSIGFFTEPDFFSGEFLEGDMKVVLSNLLADGVLIGKISNEFSTTCEVQLCLMYQVLIDLSIAVLEIHSRTRWGAKEATGFEMFTDPITSITLYQISPVTYPCTSYVSQFIK